MGVQRWSSYATWLMDKGDTEEDEALKHVVKVKVKQRPMIGQGKGKEREHDLGHQQSWS